MSSGSSPLPIICPQWPNKLIANPPPSPKEEARINAVLNQIWKENPPLSEKLLCDWHFQITKDIVPLDYYAGGIRQIDPSRPCLAADRWVGDMQCCPYASVPGEVTKLIEVANQLVNAPIPVTSTKAERLERIAFLIAKISLTFTRIHPFLDGNGRTMRILMDWCARHFEVYSCIQVAPRPKDGFAESVFESCQKDSLLPFANYLVSRIVLAGQPVS